MKLFLAGQVLRINKEREARRPPAPLSSLGARSGFVSLALGGAPPAGTAAARFLPAERCLPVLGAGFPQPARGCAAAAAYAAGPDGPRSGAGAAAGRGGAGRGQVGRRGGAVRVPAGAMRWERTLLLRTAKVAAPRAGCAGGRGRPGRARWRRMNRIGERKVSRLC